MLDLDLSGNTVVTLNSNGSVGNSVTTFEMPLPRVPPTAISNDFNARDVSGFETSPGSGYAIAGNQYDYIYRQSNGSGETRAVLTNSDWSRFQAVTLELRPTALNGPTAGAGVALRYVDEDNYLALLIGANRAWVESRINGVTTVFDDVALPPVNGWRGIWFETGDEFIGAVVDGVEVFWGWDRTAMPQRGRVVLMTRQARADFDNLRASPTKARQVFYKGYDGYKDSSRPIVKIGGTWTEPAVGTFNSGLKQTNTGGGAVALSSGPAIGDQRVSATAQLDAWGSASPVPWFGVVARYVDAANYYYLSVRGTNQVQIRKLVNGVTTVLDAASYAVPAGQASYELRVESNQLHGFVNGIRLLWAVDDDLHEGRYGVATYRAAATFRFVSGSQQ